MALWDQLSLTRDFNWNVNLAPLSWLSPLVLHETVFVLIDLDQCFPLTSFCNSFHGVCSESEPRAKFVVIFIAYRRRHVDEQRNRVHLYVGNFGTCKTERIFQYR